MDAESILHYRIGELQKEPRKLKEEETTLFYTRGPNQQWELVLVNEALIKEVCSLLSQIEGK